MRNLPVACFSLIIIWLGFSDVCNAGIEQENVVGIWLFDEGRGNIASDSSGNGHDGEIGNGIQWNVIICVLFSLLFPPVFRRLTE